MKMKWRTLLRRTRRWKLTRISLIGNKETAPGAFLGAVNSQSFAAFTPAKRMNEMTLTPSRNKSYNVVDLGERHRSENRGFTIWKQAGLRSARADKNLSDSCCRQLHAVIDLMWTPFGKAIISVRKLADLASCHRDRAGEGLTALVAGGYLERVVGTGLTGCYAPGWKFHRGAESDIAAGGVVDFTAHTHKPSAPGGHSDIKITTSGKRRVSAWGGRRRPLGADNNTKKNTDKEATLTTFATPPSAAPRHNPQPTTADNANRRILKPPVNPPPAPLSPPPTENPEARQTKNEGAARQGELPGVVPLAMARKRAAKAAEKAYFRFVAAVLKGKAKDPRKRPIGC
jgi:hypothetical protein